MSVRLRKGIHLALGGIACVLTWIIFNHGARIYCCDATAYVEHALDVSRAGVLGGSYPMMSFRAYGYPFFVALVSLITDHQPQSIHIAVTVAQLALVIVAALVVSASCARLLRVRVVTVAAIVLTPLLLIMATSLLADLLSALCAAMAIALVFSRRGERARITFASLFLAGLAAMARPASVVFVPMVLLLWLVRGRYLPRLPLRSWASLLVGAVLPFVPQVLNNQRLYGSSTPLIVRHLYDEQVNWGLRYLKYGTLIPAEQLFYLNPWYSEGNGTIGQWLLHHPLPCLATLAMHLFALFDQDYGFVYIADRQPWYRWPLTTMNLLYLFIAVTTLAMLLWRIVSRRRIGAIGLYTLATTMTCLGYIGVYLPTAVESRFSLPVYVLLAPFFALGVRAGWCGLQQRRWAVAGRWSVAAAVFVLGGARLSHWLAQQAPSLR